VDRENTVHKRFFILLLVALIGVVPAVDASAEDKVTMDVRAGFDGYYKLGSWIPISVVIANEGAEIEGKLRYSSPDVVYTQRVVLPTHSRKQYTLYPLVPYNERELKVELVQGEKTLAEGKVRVQPLDRQDFLYGVVSDDIAALSYLAGLPPRVQRRVHVAHLGLSDLSAQPNALLGIDMLVIESLDTSALTAAQRESLREWVAMGGHLVVCGGPNAALTASGLGDLLPAEIEGTETTKDVSALSQFAGAPLVANVPAVVARVSSVAPGAQVLAGAPGRPLLIRRTLGAGYADWIALDPDLEPMRSWVGAPSFWSKLTFGTPLTERTPDSGDSIRLQGAASNIPSLDVPSVFLVIGFLFLYVMVVGPLNLLVLKLLDRRAWAWVTVPVLILLFSCAAYAVGHFSRGRKVIVSQVAIVRAQLGSGTAIVEGFAGLYSPSRQTYDVRLPEGVLVQPPRSSYYPMGAVGSDKLTVEQGIPPVVRDVEVDVGGMRGFAMSDVQSWAAIEANLTQTPVAGGRYHLQGTISNKGSSAIEDCVLLFQSHALHISSLAPGETRTVSAEFQPTASLLTYQLIEEMLGSTPLDRRERRERDRRREVLTSAINLPTTQLGPGAQQPALIGWLSENPLPLDVVGRPSVTHATTLFIAPLPVWPGKPEASVLPHGEPELARYRARPFSVEYRIVHNH
jgi:hypothetical protein